MKWRVILFVSMFLLIVGWYLTPIIWNATVNLKIIDIQNVREIYNEDGSVAEEIGWQIKVNKQIENFSVNDIVIVNEKDESVYIDQVSIIKTGKFSSTVYVVFKNNSVNETTFYVKTMFIRKKANELEKTNTNSYKYNFNNFLEINNYYIDNNFFETDENGKFVIVIKNDYKLFFTKISFKINEVQYEVDSDTFYQEINDNYNIITIDFKNPKTREITYNIEKITYKNKITDDFDHSYNFKNILEDKSFILKKSIDINLLKQEETIYNFDNVFAIDLKLEYAHSSVFLENVTVLIKSIDGQIIETQTIDLNKTNESNLSLVINKPTSLVYTDTEFKVQLISYKYASLGKTEVMEIPLNREISLKQKSINLESDYEKSNFKEISIENDYWAYFDTQLLDGYEIISVETKLNNENVYFDLEKENDRYYLKYSYGINFHYQTGIPEGKIKEVGNELKITKFTVKNTTNNTLKEVDDINITFNPFNAYKTIIEYEIYFDNDLNDGTIFFTNEKINIKEYKLGSNSFFVKLKAKKMSLNNELIENIPINDFELSRINFSVLNVETEQYLNKTLTGYLSNRVPVMDEEYIHIQFREIISEGIHEIILTEVVAVSEKSEGKTFNISYKNSSLSTEKQTIFMSNKTLIKDQIKTNEVIELNRPNEDGKLPKFNGNTSNGIILLKDETIVYNKYFGLDDPFKLKDQNLIKRVSLGLYYRTEEQNKYVYLSSVDEYNEDVDNFRIASSQKDFTNEKESGTVYLALILEIGENKYIIKELQEEININDVKIINPTPFENVIMVMDEDGNKTINLHNETLTTRFKLDIPEVINNIDVSENITITYRVNSEPEELNSALQTLTTQIIVENNQFFIELPDVIYSETGETVLLDQIIIDDIVLTTSDFDVERSLKDFFDEDNVVVDLGDRKVVSFDFDIEYEIFKSEGEDVDLGNYYIEIKLTNKYKDYFYENFNFNSNTKNVKIIAGESLMFSITSEIFSKEKNVYRLYFNDEKNQVGQKIIISEIMEVINE